MSGRFRCQREFATIGRRFKSRSSASGLVRPRPADDATTPSDHLTTVQDEDRHGPLAAKLLDLRTVTRIRRPGPRPQASALHPLDLVRVPSVIERLGCPSAWMGERRRRAAGKLLQRTGVENHAADPTPGIAIASSAAVGTIMSSRGCRTTQPVCTKRTAGPRRGRF